MKNPSPIIFALSFCFLSFFGFKASSQNCKEIIGYYPSWQWYNRAELLSPDNLNYKQYTIINYAFFAPDDNGNIWGTDAWADSVLLRGKYDWSSPVQPAYIANTSLIDIGHAWGVKIIPSIGGWTLSDKFPMIAADSVKRHRFASQCAELIRSFHFDGIDIDWEYPGYTDHKGTPADKKNFTLFMQAIRDSIDAVGKNINQKMLLTAALGCGDQQFENIEYEKIKNILDYLNMMTYDFNGTWSSETNHNSPLNMPAKGSPGSYERTYNTLTQKFGVPSEKINMGVAFYGRTFTTQGKPELYATHSGKEDKITFARDEGMPQYFNILLAMDKFDDHWDDTAKVPYLTGKKINTFVTYDNERSIRLKAEYVRDKNMAGVIIWDVTGDYVERKPGSGLIKSTPLADVLVDVLKPCEKKRIKKRWY
ncbi:MAG: glycoside hydrolase family 18 protein [Cytophagaceae bacterium]